MRWISPTRLGYGLLGLYLCLLGCSCMDYDSDEVAFMSPWEYFLRDVRRDVKSAYEVSPLNDASTVVVSGHTRCEWQHNTICKSHYAPVCVTDLHCIFIVRNKCHLDKMNCDCRNYHVLDPKFCNNFTEPRFHRCQIKLYIQ